MNDTKVEFSYTNSCTCEVYDEINNEYYSSDDCYGYCYDVMIEDFKNITLDLFELNCFCWFWRLNSDFLFCQHLCYVGRESDFDQRLNWLRLWFAKWCHVLELS